MTTRILANCMVGLGFSRGGFQAALKLKPDLIGCDAGSADGGPYYLGSGKDSKSRAAVRSDVATMLRGAIEVGVPLSLGSCGGAGADVHVERYVDLVGELAGEMGASLRVAVISAELPRDLVVQAVREERVGSLGPGGELTEEAVTGATRLVGMIGVEPFADALDNGADVVLAGRCTDPAIFAAAPILRGEQLGASWHAAKCIDKGYLATTDPSRGSPVLAQIDGSRFRVWPARSDVACTPESVSRVTLHENPDPYRIEQPSGTLVTNLSSYSSDSDRGVLVEGSRFETRSSQTVKIEAAGPIGYRSVLVAGIRNPRLLHRFPEYLTRYEELLRASIERMGIASSTYRLVLRAYGHDGVLGDAEPETAATPKEVGLLVDVIADTQEMATAIARRAGPVGSRLDPFGDLSGGGNFAYPFSPSVLEAGEVFEWSAWHVVDVGHSQPFSVDWIEV